MIPDHLTPPRGTPSWEAFFKRSAEVLDEEEKRVLKLAERLLKDDPIGQWLLAQRGIGPALGVSILGEILPLDRFASPRRLWAYAGLSVDDQGRAVRRRKGVRANWNSRLKTRLYLFGVSILKCGDSPWRTLYDTRKAYEIARAPVALDSHVINAPGDESEDAGAQIPTDSQMTDAPGAHGSHGDHTLTEPGLGAQSMTEGQSPVAPEPGAPKPLSKLQIHYRALRVVEKALLLDLWRLSRGQAPLVGVVEP